ncbi:MAG: TonB-dependent receptor plug domain-containing protein [Pyrinomonadaceae bacterium]
MKLIFQGCLPAVRLLAILVALTTSVNAAQSGATQGKKLEGLVVDQSGAPVAGADVSFEGEASRSVSVRTDTDGSFVLEIGAAGAGRLVVRAQGFATAEQRLSERRFADAAEALRVVLAPASVAEQVTVTASRVATRLSDTAASILVLSSLDLARTPAVSLDDALRQIPGFTLFRRSGSRTANPTAQGVSLRGVGASGASRALVLADGVPLNDPFGGWVYWGRVPREAVNRVEVLRGGASDLYGSAGLGGVINILTNNLNEDHALSFEADYGNQRTPNASLFAGKRFGPWAATLSAEGFYTDGYVIVDEAERGPVDTPAGSKHTTLNVSFERTLGKGGRAFLRGHTYGEVRQNGTPLQTNRTHIRQVTGGAEWSSDTLGSLSTRSYVGDQIYDQDFSAIAANRQSESLTRSQRVPAQSTGFTAQWSRAAGSRQAFVAGLTHARCARKRRARLYRQSRLVACWGGRARKNHRRLRAGRNPCHR